MGITGLLPLVQSITSDVHISEYEGKVVGIDAFCWLHRAVYSCATELCLGKPTDKWLNFVVRRIEMLLYHKVKPVVVFDGGSLPMKAETNRARREAREAALQKGLSYHKAGNWEMANNCFRQACSINFDMMKRFQSYLDKVGVEWLVAPYEADAQLAFLSRNGWVDAVISEDSDLLAYGCRTVLFKVDKTGQGKQVRFEDLGNITNPSLVNFDMDMFRIMCILSGCDYVDSIPGIGLKKAHDLVRRHRTLEGVLQAIVTDPRKLAIPNGYVERVKLADLTFRHQRVWDHVRNCMVHLTPMPVVDAASVDPRHNDFLGPDLPEEVAYGVSSGRLNPHTHEPHDPLAKKTLSLPILAPDKPKEKKIDSYFSVTPKAKAEFKAPKRTKSDPFSDVASKLQKFREEQSRRSSTDGSSQASDVILAPSTPEKSNDNGRKPLLNGLVVLRQAHDNTPERIQESPLKVKVVVASKFFDGNDGVDGPRKNLLDSLGFYGSEEEEEEEEEEQQVVVVEEEEDQQQNQEAKEEEERQQVVSTNPFNMYASPHINSSVGRISLKGGSGGGGGPSSSRDMAQVVNDLLAPSIARAKVIQSSPTLITPTAEEEEEKKEEEEKQHDQQEQHDDDDSPKRSTSRPDLSVFAYRKRESPEKDDAPSAPPTSLSLKPLVKRGRISQFYK